MKIDELTSIVINQCIKIHTKLGPGCFEKVYEEALCYELLRLGIFFRRQLLLDVFYEELLIQNAYKLDLLVEEMLVIELKSVYPLPPVFFKQITTQLSLLNLKHGILINFKVPLMKEGLHRVFNNFGKEKL